MTSDTLIKISPIIGGTILIVVCLIAILRNPGMSNTFAILLAFGALLFVILSSRSSISRDLAWSFPAKPRPPAR